MKIKNIHIKNFKRFTDLKIGTIPRTAKMVVLVGPNGCGKTSVFEAFNHQHNLPDKDKNDHSLYFQKFSSMGCSDPYIKSEYHFYEYAAFNDFDDFVFIRSAFRNDADGDIPQLEAYHKYDTITDFKKLIDTDQTVARNYKMLIGSMIEEILEEKNDSKTIKALKDQYLGQIKASMQRIFDDLIFCNMESFTVGENFNFAKGSCKHYGYLNLSGGEKSVFDLLLDIIVNNKRYENNLLCIDEPEAHIHTKLQGKLIEEIYNLFPNTGQLWITTHSLGVIMKAKALSMKHPGSIIFFDFGDRDFDQPVTLTPSPIDRVVWQKFMSVALDGLETKLAPEIIIMCEGSLEGKTRYNFDADIYTRIFQHQYPQITFVSGGASNDLQQETPEFKMLSFVLNNQSKVVRLIDRDDRGLEEMQILQAQGIFITPRRSIESYLFDKEILEKLAIQQHQPELLDKVVQIQKNALEASIKRGNPADNYKKAAGDIVKELKKLLGLTCCGHTIEAFVKETLCPLITSDTKLYQEMEHDIIKPILENT